MSRRLIAALASLGRHKLTTAEWAAIAIRAARSAKLCDEDIASLRTNLENEHAIAAQGGTRLLLIPLLVLLGCATARPTMNALEPDAGAASISEQPDAQLDASPDAAVALDAAAVDAGPPAPCFATSLLGSLCLATAPSGPLVLLSTIDTDRDCALVRVQRAGPDVCILAGTELEVRAGAIVVATGSRPLVLVATGRIAVAGDLVARSATGMRGAVACTPSGGEAFVSGFSPTFNRAGGGGGAGGTFGGIAGTGAPPGLGGAGGIGGNPVAAPDFGRGVALFADLPTGLVGGCPGGHGGGDLAGASGGIVGAGGGAIYLVAGQDLEVTGRIVAVGADGGPGDGPGEQLNGGGGGGGGSGGTIALEAPRVVVGGSLLVDGGIGGIGGRALASSGAPLAGGVAGAGGTSTTAAIAGTRGGASPCGSGCTGAGGGGGGGGVGSVRVFTGAD